MTQSRASNMHSYALRVTALHDCTMTAACLVLSYTLRQMHHRGTT